MSDDFTEIRSERRDAVGWLTLHRPEALNALTSTMVDELTRAFAAIEDDDEIRAVVLTGAGRAFCAGADLKASKARAEGGDGSGRTGAEMAAHFLGSLGVLMDRIESFPKPVLAAINGVAVAGGLELLLCCDLVLAADNARIGDAHANYGLLPGAGGSVRLPRRVGETRAKHLMFTGEIRPAADLVGMGLVNQVVPADQLAAAAQELAQRLAEKSPLMLRRMKQLVTDGLEQPRDVALRSELVMNALHFNSHDRLEGLKAFGEKRKPRFTGR
jgi:enoyl-CoA hydratase